MANPEIGFVTSTRLDPALRDRFITGLEASGVWRPSGITQNVDIRLQEANGSYSSAGDEETHPELYDQIRQFNNRPNVKLIVSVGGLVSAHAAVKRATAIIISADPFFADKKNRLVDKANSAVRPPGGGTTRVPVCYPFDIYNSATPQPDPATSVWLGPDLGAAYELLGTQAATALTAIEGGKEPPIQFVTVTSTTRAASLAGAAR